MIEPTTASIFTFVGTILIVGTLLSALAFIVCNSVELQEPYRSKARKVVWILALFMWVSIIFIALGEHQNQ